MDVTKFYIRHREGYPELEMHDLARRGFYDLGVETAPFEWVDDIDEKMPDLGPTVGVAGYIGDVWAALKKLGKPIPDPVDYPEELQRFLGREVRQTTLGEVRQSTKTMFVKPVEHKLFTGFVWRGCGDRESRMRIVTQGNEAPVWVCDAITMHAEFRCFVLDGEILDVRRYKGNWGYGINRTRVEEAVAATKGPRAYALDFAESDRGTVLVEKNDGFALGSYGLKAVDYAKMLAARWSELATQEAT